MIGLMILAVIYGYIFFSRFIIRKVYESYGTKKAKKIALAIMILIPTWDIILGYPIYAYLCATQAGIHIYKTIDNVEGFYYGGKYDVESEPFSPYRGYKYVEYEETKNGKSTGKYYKSYWVDNNTSKNCVPPNPKYKFGDYMKAFRGGKCVVKKEISESEVSRWELSGDEIESKINIPFFNIAANISFKITDRKSKKILGELIECWWGGGWVTDSLRNFTRISGFRCYGIAGESSYQNLYIKILKPKKEEKLNDNN